MNEKKKVEQKHQIQFQPKDSIVADLIRRSFESCIHSYCPYSRFPVGAALLCNDGTIFTGCNVENAAYSMGICAERTALVKAVSEGHRQFKAIAISAPKYPDFISPCGACRQSLTEFGTEWIVYMCRSPTEYIELKTGDLIPYCFTPDKFNESINSVK